MISIPRFCLLRSNYLKLLKMSNKYCTTNEFYGKNNNLSHFDVSEQKFDFCLEESMCIVDNDPHEIDEILDDFVIIEENSDTQNEIIAWNNFTKEYFDNIYNENIKYHQRLCKLANNSIVKFNKSEKLTIGYRNLNDFDNELSNNYRNYIETFLN